MNKDKVENIIKKIYNNFLKEAENIKQEIITSSIEQSIKENEQTRKQEPARE
ncbi:MAG: hypothetical protein WC870_03130 [Candidatus Paceibacterota bacterium]